MLDINIGKACQFAISSGSSQNEIPVRGLLIRAIVWLQRLGPSGFNAWDVFSQWPEWSSRVR